LSLFEVQLDQNGWTFPLSRAFLDFWQGKWPKYALAGGPTFLPWVSFYRTFPPEHTFFIFPAGR
jgi:hypothetical protein